MKAFNSCDEFYAVNQAIANVFLDYGAKRLPLVQRNGTDFVPIFNDKDAANLVNETYNIAPDQTVFLFVGRICKLKNVFFLCDSLAKLKDKNFKMLFVGTGQDELASYKEGKRNNFALKYNDANIFLSIIFPVKITF